MTVQFLCRLHPVLVVGLFAYGLPQLFSLSSPSHVLLVHVNVQSGHQVEQEQRKKPAEYKNQERVLDERIRPALACLISATLWLLLLSLTLLGLPVITFSTCRALPPHTLVYRSPVIQGREELGTLSLWVEQILLGWRCGSLRRG